MALVFPSTEWLDAYRDAINASRDYASHGREWRLGPVALVAQREGAAGLDEDAGVWLDVHEGRCRTARLVSAAEAATAPFCITGSFARWKQVIRGELDPIKAMMQGHLRLQGDLSAIVRYVKAAQALVVAASQVDTVFPDGAGARSDTATPSPASATGSAALEFLFTLPTRIVFALGSAREAGLELDRAGGTRCVLVTDRFLRERTNMTSRVEAALGARLACVYDGVVPDAPVATVEEAAELARRHGADSVVSVGGGSALDTGKGVALLLAEGGPLARHQGFQRVGRRIAPHVAVPTTAGTGSEVSYAFIVKDDAMHRKTLYCDHHFIPDVAILDPTLTSALPPRLTAATGLDALTHAIEALHSLQAEPIADALALHAIRLVRRALLRAVRDGGDLAARSDMLLAATLAGAAFSNAQVGLVHAMAHTVGASHGLHHGHANAICLPHVIVWNAEFAPEPYVAAADAMGLGPFASDRIAAHALAGALWDLASHCGLETSLASMQVAEEALGTLAEGTLSDGSIVYNPRPIRSADDVLPVWRAAFVGSRPGDRPAHVTRPTGDPRVLIDPDSTSNGLVLMLGDLLSQNLLRHPRRTKDLAGFRSTVAIVASDGDDRVEVTVTGDGEQVLLRGGLAEDADAIIHADYETVIALSRIPMTIGVPHMLHPVSVNVGRKLFGGRLRISLRRPRALRGLIALLRLMAVDSRDLGRLMEIVRRDADA